MHHVLVYVDLQKQLIALEAQLRKENEEAQERFNAALPKNTPSVIPEIIQITARPPSELLTSSNATDNIDLSIADDIDISDSTPRSQKTVNSRTNAKRARRIKSLIKSTAKRIASRIGNSSVKNVDQSSPSPTSNFEQDIHSLRVELSVPPSPSQSTVRSRTSSMKPKAPFKSIFIPKLTHNRADSADTHDSVQQISPCSFLDSSVQNNSPQSLIFTPSTPASPITNSPVIYRSPNNYACESNGFKSTSENRDSGISLVSPKSKSSSSQHSREHSISSLLRRIELFNAPPKEHNQRTEKDWAGPKSHDNELLAFRYPSSKNMDQVNQTYPTNNELLTRRQKEKERLVTFDLNYTQESETSTNITKFERNSDSYDGPRVSYQSDDRRGFVE
ncbi:6520_t:CDS:1 [Acaulospora colombiana]|uniref:6520_t:CDS:1 n=1 Tax=Acaulospora colombiana TaxID=27376 RepID=A0ACA9KQ16_9GLOM|nr:6520_t:CDS:1 [Acaulospora colombiana]